MNGTAFKLTEAAIASLILTGEAGGREEDSTYVLMAQQLSAAIEGALQALPSEEVDSAKACVLPMGSTNATRRSKTRSSPETFARAVQRFKRTPLGTLYVKY